MPDLLSKMACTRTLRVASSTTESNAETLPDHMRLDYYGSTNSWREGLEHHAIWLRGLPFRQANLDAEKPKVNLECDFTVKNFATHKFAIAAWAQGYRHNQNHAAMKGDIRKATLGEIQKCRDGRFVVLSNVVVCAVGGLEPAIVLPAFAEKLGMLKSGANPVAPVKTHPQNRDLSWDLDARHLVLTWAIPSMEKDDYAALLVAAPSLARTALRRERVRLMPHPASSIACVNAANAMSAFRARLKSRTKRLRPAGREWPSLPFGG